MIKEQNIASLLKPDMLQIWNAQEDVEFGGINNKSAGINQTFAAALIMAGPPISMFSIPSSNSIPPVEVTLS